MTPSSKASPAGTLRFSFGAQVEQVASEQARAEESHAALERRLVEAQSSRGGGDLTELRSALKSSTLLLATLRSRRRALERAALASAVASRRSNRAPIREIASELGIHVKIVGQLARSGRANAAALCSPDPMLRLPLRLRNLLLADGLGSLELVEHAFGSGAILCIPNLGPLGLQQVRAWVESERSKTTDGGVLAGAVACARTRIDPATPAPDLQR